MQLGNSICDCDVAIRLQVAGLTKAVTSGLHYVYGDGRCDYYEVENVKTTVSSQWSMMI